MKTPSDAVSGPENGAFLYALNDGRPGGLNTLYWISDPPDDEPPEDDTPPTPPDDSSGEILRRLQVNMMRSSLGRLVSETDASFSVTSPFVSITFDAKALRTIYEADTGWNVTVSACATDNSAVSEENRARVSGRPVYTFSVKNGNTVVSHLGGGHATVTIPYELQIGESPNAVAVYSPTGDGSLKVVRGHYRADLEAMVFRTPRFATFVIGHNPVSFGDVSAGAWYKEAVDFIAARGITSGTGGGMYSPGDADKVADWAEEALSYLVGAGMVHGSANNLDPATGTTRSQITQVLYNLLSRSSLAKTRLHKPPIPLG